MQQPLYGHGGDQQNAAEEQVGDQTGPASHHPQAEVGQQEGGQLQRPAQHEVEEPVAAEVGDVQRYAVVGE